MGNLSKGIAHRLSRRMPLLFNQPVFTIERLNDSVNSMRLRAAARFRSTDEEAAPGNRHLGADANAAVEVVDVGIMHAHAAF